MESTNDHSLVLAPRDGVNDDFVRIVEWLVAEGERVAKDTPLVVLETTKATFNLDSPRAGYVFHLAVAGAEVAVGSAVAIVGDRPERPASGTGEESPKVVIAVANQIVSTRARALIEQHRLAPALFSGLEVVRVSDVEALLARSGAAAISQTDSAGSSVAADANWDERCDTELRREIDGLLGLLRERMKARFNRHVPTGDLLNDRWKLAKAQGFGEGTSVYDSCLIMGDVKVGRKCWIGPNAILDGLHGQLTIGDFVDVGAGAQIYTHNTIERALTGHKAALFSRPTTIGNCCFIAPQSTVAPGSVLGDHCFVAAGSYVEGTFPAFSFIAGNPAKQVGVVELRDNRARIRPLSAKRAESE